MTEIMADHTDEGRLHTLRHAAYRVADVRAMERPLLDGGVPLMRMAAQAAAHMAAGMLDDEDLALEDTSIVLLAGAGDNGGDGLFAARRAGPGGRERHRHRRGPVVA